MKKRRTILILPAYNAAKTLVSVIRAIPKGIFDEVLLVDDHSLDDTYSVANKQKDILVYRTIQNLGYGGNLKMCLGIALERGADIIIELHPDGEYGTDGILPALGEISKGAEFVLGNRFVGKTAGLKSGMFWWKYIFIRVLTWIDNIFLGTRIADMHQGFRVYTRELLEQVNFRAGSNGYVFSFEIIAQAAFRKIPIANVPVSTFYRGKKRGASLRSSIMYALGTFRILLLFSLERSLLLRLRLFTPPGKDPLCPNCQISYLVEERFSQGAFALLFCKICKNGFTHPVPVSLGHYYGRSYWQTPGFLGGAKRFVFRLFQARRRKWIMQYVPNGGNILDVGSGEGEFGKSLPESFTTANLDAPFAKLQNKDVIKVDFLTWEVAKRFDTIVFWESLEHVPKPQQYLEKAAKLLKKNGFVLIEYPRFASLERRLFGRYWFHLDIPRHLAHLTDDGLEMIAQRVGLTKVRSGGIVAIDYAPWGFLASVLKAFGFKEEELRRNFFTMLVLAPLMIVAVLIELVFSILGQSPIGFVVLRRDHT